MKLFDFLKKLNSTLLQAAQNYELSQKMLNDDATEINLFFQRFHFIFFCEYYLDEKKDDFGIVLQKFNYWFQY